MKKLPPLGALRYFKSAAEHLSFKHASEELFVTQAAISQHIKTLETQLGCKLFIRKNREISLTAQGRSLLPYVQRAFRELQTGVSQLEEDFHPNVLKMTVLPSIATFWLIPRLHLFRAAFPEMQVKMIPDPFVVDFDNFNLDLAIRYGEGSYENLESRHLFSEKVYMVAHPSLIKPDMQPEDLYTHPVITENYHDTNDAWDDFLPRFNLSFEKFSNVIEIRDATPALVGAVLAGKGISLIRRSLVEDYLKNGQLVRLFDYAHQCKDSYYLVAPEHHFNFPKVKAFEQWLRLEAKELINSSNID